MSDRARSSVRTGTRSGSGTSDELPEAAGPVDDETAALRSESKPADAAPAGATAAAAAPAVEPAAPQAASPVEAEQAPAPTPAPPAAHPVTPLGPPAGTRSADDGARPVTSPAPPVPPSTGMGRAVGSRGGVPAGPLPVDSTQAVTLPPAGARPVDPASRPSAVRPDSRGRAGTEAPVRGESAARPEAASGGKVRGAGRGPRRARLQLRHIDTFSALKISLVVSIALFFVWMVAVAVLYGVLGQLGVFDTINDLIGQLSSSSGDDAGNTGTVIHGSIVFGGAAIIGAVNVVLLTALCTIAAFVYNLMADLVGGLEVTLAERD